MKSTLQHDDKRIMAYSEAIRQLAHGNYQVNIQTLPLDAVGHIGVALQDLAHTLEKRHHELKQLDQITLDINAGLFLEDILEKVYQEFHNIIPYNRIGLSLIEDDQRTINARWVKTDQLAVYINPGYSSSLQGSSLEEVIRTKQPRILNNLATYLEHKPDSISTQLIVAEGIRSSLTCPLVIDGVVTGFIHFSSVYPDTYSNVHVNVFLQIAAHLSMMVEKGRLVSEMAVREAKIERQHEELRRLYALQDEYMQQAAQITRAAEAVERGTFSDIQLVEVSKRTDALGTLARVFQKMTHEVYLREKNLQQQMQKLQIEIDEVHLAQQVAKIKETDSFHELREKARQIRTLRAISKED